MSNTLWQNADNGTISRRPILKEYLVEVFLGGAMGFLVGDIAVGGIVWLVHGLMTAHFGTTIPIRYSFGVAYTVGGCLVPPIFRGIRIIMKNNAEFVIGTIILAFVILSVVYGVNEYDKIIGFANSFNETFSRNHPFIVSLYYIVLFSGLFYVAWMSYKEGKKGKAVLMFVFWGLMFTLFILHVAHTYF